MNYKRSSKKNKILESKLISKEIADSKNEFHMFSKQNSYFKIKYYFFLSTNKFKKICSYHHCLDRFFSEFSKLMKNTE